MKKLYNCLFALGCVSLFVQLSYQLHIAVSGSRKLMFVIALLVLMLVGLFIKEILSEEVKKAS